MDYFRNLNFKESTRKHIFSVYSTMASLLAISSCSAYLSLTSHSSLIRMATSGALFGAIGCLIAFAYTDELKQKTRARNILYGFAAFKGLALAPLVEVALNRDPYILVLALGSACILFGCLSLSVLYANNPSQMYVSGLLMSAVSITMWVSIINMFVRSSRLFTLELVMGLGVFSLYVIADTQIMIQRAEAGSKKVLKHTMDLYMDLAGLFVRIIVLMLKKDDRKKERKNKSD